MYANIMHRNVDQFNTFIVVGYTIFQLLPYVDIFLSNVQNHYVMLYNNRYLYSHIANFLRNIEFLANLSKKNSVKTEQTGYIRKMEK